MAKRCFDELNTVCFLDSAFVQWVYIMGYPAARDTESGPSAITKLFCKSHYRLSVFEYKPQTIRLASVIQIHVVLCHQKSLSH
jgi:hypothetical protein